MPLPVALPANQIALTPEERIRFQQVYDAQLQERCGAHLPTAQQRLVFTRELIQHWRRGQACVGATLKYVQLNAAALTDPAVVDARLRPRRDASALLPYAVLIGAMVLLGLWAVNTTAGPDRRSARAVLTPTTLPGTPAPTSAPATAVTGFIAVGQRTPTALSPDSLELGRRSFVVYQAAVDKDKNWRVSADPSYANWLAGSIVNWTFALMLQEDADPDTPAFLRRISDPGQLITLRVRSGEGLVTTHTFRIDQTRSIKRTETEIFDMRTPGLTLIVRSDDSDLRLYLHGSEVLTPVATLTPEEVIARPDHTALPTPIPVASPPVWTPGPGATPIP